MFLHHRPLSNETPACNASAKEHSRGGAKHSSDSKEPHYDLCKLCGKLYLNMDDHMQTQHPRYTPNPNEEQKAYPQDGAGQSSETWRHNRNFCRLCARFTSDMRHHILAFHPLFKPTSSEEQKYRPYSKPYAPNGAWHTYRTETFDQNYCKLCGIFSLGLNDHMYSCPGYKSTSDDDQAHKPYAKSQLPDGAEDDHSFKGKHQADDVPESKPAPHAAFNKVGVLYAILAVSPYASHEETLRAAKLRRVEMHPDRRKMGEGLSQAEKDHIDEEAAQVGYAADILSNRSLRARYDEQVREGRQR